MATFVPFILFIYFFSVFYVHLRTSSAHSQSVIWSLSVLQQLFHSVTNATDRRVHHVTDRSNVVSVA